MTNDIIEELIEESYLLALTESDIRVYLTNFIESCDVVINTRLNGSNDIRIIGIKVALLRARFMIHSNESDNINPQFQSAKDGDTTSHLIEHVLDTKRLILKLISSIDPSLTDVIQITMTEKRNRPDTMDTVDSPLFTPGITHKLGYIGLFFLVTSVFLIYIAY